MGAGFYQGFQGGLYPEGSNVRPAAHHAAGVAIANSLAPLDTAGNPDPVGGQVVFLSIGMSNCTQEFSTFVPKALIDPYRRSSVLVIDCAKGGQSADRIDQPTAAYWDTVFTRLRGHGSSPLQAQVAWIKEADAGPTGGFPASAETLEAHLKSVVQIAKDKLPNLRLAYLTSRIYAGYATTSLNPEPYAYESGFAVKWLIEAQVSGDPSLNSNPNAGPVEAPWLSWGPYLWADGLVPRSDGLVWPCEYFSATDGTHPAQGARNLVADSLLAFLHQDETTAPWYLSGPVSVPGPAPGFELAVTPNPWRDAVDIRFSTKAGEGWRLEVLDLMGRQLSEPARGSGMGGPEVVRWDGRDRAGREVPAGLYWVRLVQPKSVAVRRVVRLEAD